MVKKENSKATKAQDKAQEKAKVTYTVEVLRAKEIKDNTYGVDLIINGVKVYGCIFKQGIKDGKEWSLLDFPSRKGSDGNYYTYCWCPLDKGTLAVIEGQIAEKLNA